MVAAQLLGNIYPAASIFDWNVSSWLAYQGLTFWLSGVHDNYHAKEAVRPFIRLVVETFGRIEALAIESKDGACTIWIIDLEKIAEKQFLFSFEQNLKLLKRILVVYCKRCLYQLGPLKGYWRCSVRMLKMFTCLLFGAGHCVNGVWALLTRILCKHVLVRNGICFEFSNLLIC